MNSVIKGASYVLAHTPDMVLYNGTTQTTERIVNPDSEYLKEVPEHLRSYEDCVAYWPNQTYIGNVHPDELAQVEAPWYDKKMENASRYGKYGEIMPEEEFLFLVQISDQFEVVKLEKNFVEKYKGQFAANPIITEDISSQIEALLYAVRNAGIEKADVEYVIDCAEEACGDMNQRGGGNFAKAAAEVAGLVSASGSDARGFCAAPTHALIEAAALVKSGAYKCVAVTAGGCTAKLGMNGKDHIKKGLPILEDCLGGFCVILAENDGVNPEIDLSMLGRHSVGTGSAPQNVIGSLVADPLDRAGMKITDIDKYSPEMQNPDITKPAGAGDVPLANYKMIAALAVKRGELDRKEIGEFPAKHGLTGWAPTQGHIPSGVPYVGVAREDILEGKIKNAMIIGKGSLFLGRMTNLFDGVSFVIHGNTKAQEEAAAGVSEDEVKGLIAKAMTEFAATLIAE